MTELSTRALKLLDRVRDPANWYKAYDKGTPAAMRELVDAGLVTIGGRVEVISAAWVPVGTENFQFEKYPGQEDAS